MRIILLALVMTFSLVQSVLADPEMDKFKQAYASYNKKIEAGDIKGALPFAKEAYDAGKLVFNPDSANLSALADNYSFVKLNQGDAKGAEAVYLDLLAANEGFFGRYAASLVPIYQQLQKITFKTDPDASKDYGIRALKLDMRNNPKKYLASISEGTLKSPKGDVKKMRKRAEASSGRKFKTLESDHWTILYTAGSDKGAEIFRSQLELVYKSIREYMIALNFAQKPLKEKQVAVLFSGQEEYLYFLEKYDLSTRSKGAYFEDMGALIFFDRVHKRSDWEYFKQTNIIAEEAIQQIAVAAKMLNKNPKYYPKWFYDGLSRSFSFNNIEQPFGPFTDNLSSRGWEQAQQLIDDEEWLTLRDFIRTTKAQENSRGSVHKDRIYYMGFFLVRFLHLYYTDELIDYLRLLPTTSLNAQSANDRQRSFEKAFGDVEKMEGKWRAYLERNGITFYD